MAAKLYRKLAGKGSRPGHIFTWYTLWQGPDHFLQIETSGYTEEYKRFFYKNIQSITLRKTNRGRNWNIFLLTMLGLGAALLLSVSSTAARVAWGIWAGLFAFFAVINLLMGPTATCRVKTAVQQEDLPSLKRLRKCRKVLARLRPEIATAQGLLNNAEVLALSGETTAPAPNLSAAPPPSTPPP